MISRACGNPEFGWILSSTALEEIVQETNFFKPQIYINKIVEREIVIIFLPINFNICSGFQKNRLIETILLSTHNKLFGLRNKKKCFLGYALPENNNYIHLTLAWFNFDHLIRSPVNNFPVMSGWVFLI